MLNLIQIRKRHYDHQRNKLINMDANIDDWKFSPYNCLKARIYIEFSSIVVFFLQYTKVSPNQVTFLYVLSGILGGVLLSSDNQTLIIIGCLIIFFKTSRKYIGSFRLPLTSRFFGNKYGLSVSMRSLFNGINEINFSR